MKNVDVPLWDKGDKTDNFTRGGARAKQMSLEGMVEVDKGIEKIFKMVLGRKPSTRESAYYRISRMEKEDIIAKLLSGTEHKELIKNAKKYPEVVDENKQQKGTILKLKSEHKSRTQELEELGKLLEEKNVTIKNLRAEKGKPYITNHRILEESMDYKPQYKQVESADNEKTWWEKIIDLFFR
ncbi:MAG TPA: hypothetical protein VJY47_02775 [Candidatus Dojkabacteria bacterium]|nr:hypothetical protein [Candidatus Dojkabacteria bacterium]